MFASEGAKTARKLKTDDRPKARAKAEARFARAPRSAKPSPSTAALLHELQVHQIELEMQNEELRRSKLELEDAHHRQVDLYDFAPVGYVTLAGDGVIIAANLTAATLLGVERGSLLRRRFPEFVAGVDGDRWHRAFVALLQGDERAVHRLTITRGDGANFDADVIGERRSGHDGNRVRMVLTDVTGIARIERESQETKERFSLVIDSTGSGYTDWDIPSGRVKYSKRFANMLGYDLGELEPTVATWERLVHPEDRQRCWDAAQPHLRGETAQHECEERLQHKDGRWLWTMLRAKVVARDAGGAPLRFVGTHTDITETRALQSKLVMASRLAAMGTLVSGVAHEINNPLAAEMADQGIALEVVREVRDRLLGDSSSERVADGRALDGVVEALEDATASGERIARIVKDLAVFGKPDAKRQRARPMDIVDGALRWLPAPVARSATIKVENVGAPDVIASAGQIEQILVNLLTNAAKATPEGQRDTIIVRVGPGLPGMARLEVIDHGTGIAPAIRGSIFDPFFTTRPAGPARGAGLGLAICHAIATGHGGTLTFESEVGKGSTFRLELPAAHAEA